MTTATSYAGELFRALRTVAMLSATVPTIALAADRTWDGEGANDNWLTAANWDPPGLAIAPPAANDSLIFEGAVRTSPFNNFAAGTIFQNVYFGAGASSFSLGGNALTLSAPAAAAYTAGLNANYIGGSITNDAPNPQTINLPLTLGNGHHNIVANGATVNFAGAVTVGGGSASFSTSVNTLGSGLANVNGILGGWATMIPPATWASLDGSGNVVGYTAFTDVGAGETIANNPADNIRLTSGGGSNALAAAGLTDINTLFMGDNGANQVVDIAAGRILRFGSKGGIFNASRTLGTSRILTIGVATGVGFVTAGGADNTAGDLYLIETPFIGNTGNQLVMNSRITNNGTGIVTVHTFGHVSYPNVTHTYSGGTHIHGGRIQTQPNILGFGPIWIYPGGQLFFNANGTCTNAIFMAGYGNAESVGNGAIRMGGTGRIITGPVTLTADAATANGTINGRITGPGGLIVGAGNANGVGTLILGATNDYAGDTLINGTNATAASTLQMTGGRPHTMPHGVGKGNLVLRGISSTIAATFNLNGTDQTINGLNSMDTETSALITNAAAPPVTLTLGDGNANGNFGGSILNSVGGIALVKIGSGTQTLRGANGYTNGTRIDGGKLVFAAVGSLPGAGAITVNSNATLDVSAICPLTLGGGFQPLTSSNGTIVVALQAGGNSVTALALNSLGNTNFITVTDIPTITSYPAQFVAIKYTALNGGLNFGLAGPLPVSPGTPFAGFVSNNVANNSVDVVITAGPSSVRWTGYSSGAPNSSWDTTTPNWATLAGSPTTYSEGSFVSFFDSASNGVVTLSQNVSPAAISVSNNVLPYLFDGGSGIGGVGGMTKRGSGTLIVANSGANTFAGDLAINSGTLQIGNHDTAGSLPVGTVVNNSGTLAFARSDMPSFANIIAGSGGLMQIGPGGVSLSGANSFTGAVTVLQGTLQIDNNSALGVTNGSTTIATGATLDVGAPSIAQDGVSLFETVFVAGEGVNGQGAIVNNSATRQLNALKFVTLTNHTSFGGVGRWDIRATGGTTGNPLGARLSTGGQPYSLIKTGANAVLIVSTTVDPALGNIEVRQGQLTIEGNTTSLGNPINTLTVQPGATLAFFSATNQMNKTFVLNGDGTTTTLLNDAGNNIVAGPMTLNGVCIIDCDSGTSLILNNILSGAGVLSKADVGTLNLNGNSPDFLGSVLVSAGAVVLNGSLATGAGVHVSLGKFALNGVLQGTAGLTNDAGSSIAGSGSMTGPVSASGQISPGDTNGVVGTLTVGHLFLEPGASLDFDLTSTNTVGIGTNDLVVVNGNLTVNGNAITINPLFPLQKGISRPYRLFNYTGSLIWNGDLSVTGPNGYTFTVDTNTAGQINIVASGGPPVWDGGSLTGNNWSDAANWGGLAISSGNTLYFAGNARLNNTNDITSASFADIAFNFDAGSFQLNGNPITLTGNLINGSANVEAINLGLNYGDNRTFNGAVGPLAVGGGVTNTANLTQLTLAGTGFLTNILGSASGSETNSILVTSSNADWTLVDNASSATMTVPWVLNVNNGTFNFGVGSSAPKLTSTSINGQPQDHIVGATAGSVAVFNMSNGVFTTTARLNTGTAGGATGIVNQVGGTMNIGSQLQGANGAATAVSFINVSGGAMNIIDTQLRTLFVASRGPGVLNVSGNGVVTCGVLDVSRSINSGIPGTVNLDGGTISATRVGTASANAGAATTGSTATFNFNGGRLKAGASSTTWFQGNQSSPAVPITANVKAGGALIDTDTNAVSVLEPLRHDPALGATPDGGLNKQGSGTLTLTAANTYTGPTVVNAGTLLINGSVSASAVTAATGTVGGNGSCGTTLTVSSGGTVAPGTGIGILTVTNNILLGGVALMEISPALNTNDLLRSISGTITYGGTLRVTNTGGALVNGKSFKLFNASSYPGLFGTLQLPGLSAGQSWNTSQLGVNGTISVSGDPVSPSITSVSLSGGLLTVTGVNGVTNGNFQVLSSINVAAPLSTWTVLGAGQFDGNGAFSIMVPVDPASSPNRFFVVRLQ